VIFVLHSLHPCSSPHSGNTNVLCKSAVVPICLRFSIRYLFEKWWFAPHKGVSRSLHHRKL